MAATGTWPGPGRSASSSHVPEDRGGYKEEGPFWALRCVPPSPQLPAQPHPSSTALGSPQPHRFYLGIAKNLLSPFRLGLALKALSPSWGTLLRLLKSPGPRAASEESGGRSRASAGRPGRLGHPGTRCPAQGMAGRVVGGLGLRTALSRAQTICCLGGIKGP